MSYTPKQGNSGNSSGAGGPNQTNNQQQTAKVLAGIAGIQQQMQNLVHGQNAAGQGAPAAINALMALRQQQHTQHFESIIKQQQLYLSNPQLVQQFQQQIQQQQNQNIGGSGSSGGGGGAGAGKEPLALTRTPAATELLNKTLQQQANGNTVAGAINSASTVAGTAGTAQQIQQQLQALAQNPGNIMQQLQAYHHQIAQQQQQQQYQSNRLPTQQFPNQQLNLATNVSTVQQQQSQHHAQQYLQTNYQQQQQKMSGTSVTSKSPSIGSQIKPPNLPAATQITPIPAPSVASTVQQQQSNNNFTTNKSQSKQIQQQQPQLPTSTTSRTTITQQQTSTVSITPTTGVVSGTSGNSNSSLTKSPILGNRSTISPISSIASSALHSHQKNSLSQQNSMINIKHQSVSSKLPPPTQITAVPLTKPTVATSSPAKSNISSNIQSPKGANVQSLSAVNQPKSIVAATPSGAVATVPNNLGMNNDTAKTSLQIQTQPSKQSATQNKIPSVNNPATTSSTTLLNVAISSPVVSTITSATTSSLTITPVSPVVVVTTVSPNVESVVPSNTSQQLPKINDVKEPNNSNNIINQGSKTDLKQNIVIAVDNSSSKPLEKSNNDKNIEKLTKDDKKLPNDSKKSEVKLTEEKKLSMSETKIDKTSTTSNQKVTENSLPVKNTEKSDLTTNVPASFIIEKVSITENNSKSSEITQNNSSKNNSDSTNLNINELSEKTDSSKKSNRNEKSTSVDIKNSKEKSPAKSVTITPANSNTSSRVNPKKKTNASAENIKNEKVENIKKASTSIGVAKELPRLRQTITKTLSTSSPTAANLDSAGGTTSAPTTPETSNEKTEGRSKRHRLKTILYQSPLPELAFITKLSASEASNSPKPSQSNEDKLIVFYKSEFLAVRNADGGFFLCQTMQNVYKTSPKIRIRWLSEEKKDTNVYIPDFYDHTDIECVLTTVDLNKVNKERLKLPNTEKERIENILKKAIDVEKGILPRPDVTEENPDGLDISLYKNESQIEKKSSSSSSKKRAVSKSPKRLSSKLKTPKKKKNKLQNKKSINKLSDKEEDEDDAENEQYDSEEETEEEEYKPSQKKKSIVAQQLVKVRAQRSPLAKARAASPITIKNQQQTSKTIVPPKNSKTDESNLANSRNNRAKRRATDPNISEEIIPSKRSSTKLSVVSKSKSEDDEPLVSPTNKDTLESNTKSSTSKVSGSNTVTGKKQSSSNLTPEKIPTASTITTPTTTSTTSGRPTRNRK